MRPLVPVPAGVSTAGKVDTLREVARIAADRARRFGLAARWSAAGKIRLVRGWLVLAGWPLAMVAACWDAPHIRRLCGGSATVKTAGRGRRRWRFTAAAVGVLLVLVAALIALEVAAMLAGNTAARVMCAAAFLAVVVPLVLTALGQALRRQREPEMTLRSLDARRDELGGAGVGYTLSEVLAARADTGDGTALIEALKPEWTAAAAVVVLYPASESLVGYYSTLGAVRDGNADRRMLFDYRTGGTP